MSSRVRLDQFDRRKGYLRGRSFVVMFLWQLTKVIFFQNGFPWPGSLRVCLLRAFGAKIGRGCVIKPRVTIHLPWKFSMGDSVWLGEEVFILNFEPIVLGHHTCISQRAFLCGGNHDYRDPAMKYRNDKIVVEDGAWIGAQVFVAPGVRIGTDAVLSAGTIMLHDANAGVIYAGNPGVAVGIRWKRS